MNIKLKDGFTQVCVWQGAVVGEDKIQDFENYMQKEFGVEVQYLEELNTKPNKLNGKSVPGTGGRTDLFFAVKSTDINKFALPRLKAGIRWIEDVYGNGGGILYPARVKGYRSWDY